MEVPKQCPYCNHDIVFTSNKEIYGKEYGNGKCYLCRNCKASVGCHDSGKPLGVLATKEMKVLKTACHDLFDLVWKTKKLGRSECYRRMSILLRIEQRDCHFGHFDIPMLMKSIHILLNPRWYEGVK